MFETIHDAKLNWITFCNNDHAIVEDLAFDAKDNNEALFMIVETGGGIEKYNANIAHFFSGVAVFSSKWSCCCFQP